MIGVEFNQLVDKNTLLYMKMNILEIIKLISMKFSLEKKLFHSR
jgi:hypothetical protein